MKNARVEAATATASRRNSFVPIKMMKGRFEAIVRNHSFQLSDIGFVSCATSGALRTKMTVRIPAVRIKPPMVRPIILWPGESPPLF